MSRLRKPDPKPAGPPPVTPSTTPVAPADAAIGPPGENEEDRLDEANQESFPASDPVSIHIEGPDYDEGAKQNQGSD
jgi:hypothetical protein